MISTISWVPRGAAKAVPKVMEPTEEELEHMKQAAGEEGDSGEEEDEWETDDSDMEGGEKADDPVERARAVASALKSSASEKALGEGSGGMKTGKLESALKELDMDGYDDEDEVQLPGLLGGKLGSAKKDPYLQLDSDEDSEIEDFNIRDSDLLILAARNEEDVSSMEVWLYEEAGRDGEANIYVHHEIMLSAFPLALAWMDCNPDGTQEAGNFAAVGTFAPEIELWDLDVIDSVEPIACLGGVLAPDLPSLDEEGEGLSSVDRKKLRKKIRKKKQKAKPSFKDGSHEDAVMSLSWNSEYRNVLASGSADYTVKIWDVTAQECKQTLSHHNGKVQAVAWNPAEASVILTGGFDKVAALVDVRTPDSCAQWALSADTEALTWCPFAPTCFLVSCEDGLVSCYDARKGTGSGSVFSLHAHEKPTCTLSFSSGATGLLATGSTDKKLKLWDVADMKPALLATEEPKVGAIFSATFCADSPFLLGCAGAKGTVAVWDTKTNPAVAAKYGSA
mmetsp:Transcript_14770/g.41589  ORF Transcript_14770/g.41589 Transcript_14770/m.41589 type:complete len:507 (+) Transcript_14770:285-1805(+)